MDDFPFVVATLVCPHGVFEVRCKTAGDMASEIADAFGLADGKKAVVFGTGYRLVALAPPAEVPIFAPLTDADKEQLRAAMATITTSGRQLVMGGATLAVPKVGTALVDASNYASSIAAARWQMFDHGPPREGDAPHIATGG